MNRGLARRRSLLTSDAPLSSQRDRPPPRPQVKAAPRKVDFSQDDARTRRRAGWGIEVHYVEFDVVAEVEAQCRPLADEVRELTSGGVLLSDTRGVRSLFLDLGGEPPGVDPHYEVRTIASAVHSLRLSVVKILAEVSVSALPDGGRERLGAVVRDPAHANVPDVSVDDLKTGAWADALMGHVAPLRDDLTAVVAASRPGRVTALDDAISEALSTPDLRGLDQSARALEHRMPELRYRRALLMDSRAARTALAQQRDQERVERALRELRLLS